MKFDITKLLIGVGTIIVLVLIALLMILDKDPTVYVGSLAAIVTVLVTNGLIGRKVETISRNVNGNTSKLLEDNERLRAIVAERDGVPAERPLSEVAPSLLTEDTIERIKTDRDKLSKPTG